ncbi:zinc ribbon domain-containing protein [Alienimonas chondri]|uniref:Zinc ribbon domain-containing protein n=1 Tax=Alienimonas chondri TaxID=2681879 RepID=A0ABX1V9S1_9PLAN|nr:zinc ribbon domain-containing protein [Alienimonas chondri]NNJ24656.1 hypothetical protein [Alienimonas chondri]
MSDDRIEFRCETCGKRLRAPATRAGAETDCPQCGDRVRVPTAAPQRAADGELLGTFTAPGEVRCPVCGEIASGDDAACPSCGELLGGMGDDPTGMGRGGPTEVTLGSVWHAAVESWKEHFGLLLAGVLLAGLIFFAVVFSLYIGVAMLVFGGFAVAAGAGGGGEGAGVLMAVLAIFGGLMFSGAVVAANSWMTLGLAGLHLEAVRSRPDLATLFKSPGFWRMMLCGLLLGFFGTILAYLPAIGIIALIGGGGGLGGGGGGEALAMAAFYLVPTAVFGGLFLLFWPVPFLCLDRPDIGHVRPLWAAIQLPAGSWGGHLAVGAAAYGLLFIGTLFCYVGLLVTAPLAGLLLAHAYDRFDRAETDAHGPRMLDPEGVI